ncbi:Gamma-soluble NSF attachment protein, putative [Perkinsus marinus ATCC 50983]|uniref:Gamma-soluble NSF attachment protein n=1 Tax=Perkinsus marinus (strain ATCC 50983 / TXsc) TaxID=423536 RepID=C5K4E3_PERM5|nr:Gamma-soluble NSF attachment protein, putative [Perkinsus marinus ATCC 50983]EER20636.1 Gamma-soluble NSF attachment protein, putative [Perkinsus marinus ATCC 50983]|eukprot:XP_002788840.1 Gamma-soluble NSF attachment protein, putative [Perkinsus marinus ATCC 50983]
MSMVEEARDHVKKAQEALHPSIWRLQFSPDYLVAALELSQAAACFQSASLNDQAAKAWLKAAELRKTNLRDFQGAARNFESAGQLVHNPEHYKSAADSYLAAGKADQAARAWTKVAGILAKTDPEGATDAYRKVVDIYRADGDVKHGGNAYALEALRVYQDWLLSRHELEKWLEASKESSTLLEAAGLYASTHKELLARVVVLLSTGDSVRADEVLASCLNVNGFLASEEMAAGEGMVIAYRNNDAEALQDAVNKNCVKFLPIEIVKIAKSLKVAELPSPSRSPGGNPGPENDATDAAEPTPEGLGALLL